MVRQESDEHREPEGVDVAYDRAVAHLWSVSEHIAQKAEEKGARERELRREALSRMLEYQIGRISRMGDDELLALDLDQQEAYIRTSFRWKLSDVRRESGDVLPPPDDDTWSDDTPPGDLPPLSGVVRLSESVALTVVIRTIELLGERTKRPKLNDDQATVVRFFLECEWGVPAMTAADRELKLTFPDNARRWKLNLARALDKRPNFVSETIIKRIAGTARTAIYLFILLAPLGRAVLDRSEMGLLLDLVFHRNRHLETHQRKLLECAALCLLIDDDSFLIDVVTLAANPGPSGPRPVGVTVGELHLAEARYAARVPSQEYHPPRFRCVTRCDLHRPIEEN